MRFVAALALLLAAACSNQPGAMAQASQSPSGAGLETRAPLPVAVRGQGGEHIGGVTVPLTGTYTYTDETRSTVSNGPAGVPRTSSSSSTITLSVASGPEASAGYHQLITSSASPSSSQTQDVLWEVQGEVEARSIDVSEGQQVECDFSPPLVELRFPLLVGGAWNIDQTCVETSNGQTVTNHTVSTEKVVGQASQSVGGVSVQTYVIDRQTTFNSTSGPRRSSSTSSGVEWFAPAYGLAVRVESDGKSTAGGTTYEAKTTSTLQDLTPS